MDQLSRIGVIIPSLDPDEKLIKLVDELINLGFENIVVINDGSKNNAIFDEIKIRNVTLLYHRENLGKGAALKTGFEFVTVKHTSVSHILTMDCDGQHLSSDAFSLAIASENISDALILGVREFRDEVPLRSFIGNQLTKGLMRLSHKINLSDTQTGLRVIPVSFVEFFLKLESKKYDFELEMLIKANEKGFSLHEIPINTVYIDDNANSHFNPILDSMRIYYVLLRFSLSSISSFLLDIVLFALLFSVSTNILAATYFSRFFSAIFNFLLCKYGVFHSYNPFNTRREALKYIVLCCLVAFISAETLNQLSDIFDTNVLILKVFVDSSLFFLSFSLQKVWVFSRRKIFAHS